MVLAMEVTREDVADAPRRSESADVLLGSAAPSDYAAPIRVGHREPLKFIFDVFSSDGTLRFLLLTCS